MVIIVSSCSHPATLKGTKGTPVSALTACTGVDTCHGAIPSQGDLQMYTPQYHGILMNH